MRLSAYLATTLRRLTTEVFFEGDRCNRLHVDHELLRIKRPKGAGQISPKLFVDSEHRVLYRATGQRQALRRGESDDA